MFILLVVSNTFAYWQCMAENTYGIQFQGAGQTKEEANVNAIFICEDNTDFGARCYKMDWCEEIK